MRTNKNIENKIKKANIMHIRRLAEYEKPFWNNTSICILSDTSLTFEINDGKIVGISFLEVKND